MRLFHKRPTATESVTDATDGDYVLPDKHIYNIPASSASKLKLPFRRKHPQDQPYDTPPRISSVTSDSGHTLPSPPRKSSLFAVYNQSLHSLPNDSSTHDTQPRLSQVHSNPPQPHKKSQGFFSWARERTKSKPPQPSPSTAPPPPVDPTSFNLKSFRHVRPDSPSPPGHTPQPSSDSLLAPPRPRPRGDSVASDSSQRISVAAFREAHARSRANSPVPSFRPPSSADTVRVDAIGRKRASTVSVLSATVRQQPTKNASPVPSTRPSPSATSDDDSDSEDNDDDEDVDSDGQPIPKPQQKRAARPPHPLPTNSLSPPHSAPPPNKLGQAHLIRKRASVSTSALTPNAAARRASILAGTNSSSSSHTQPVHPLRKPKDYSTELSDRDTSDTDSEDMPLSGLAAPRRPGSSASNNSNCRPRMPPKPLIDINTLTGAPPLLTPILRHENSIKNLRNKDKELVVEKDQPFSVPAVLALSSSPSPISPSVVKQNSPSANRPPSTAHDRRSSGDASVPSKPTGHDHDDDLINAIRLVGALDKEVDQPPVKSPLNHIIPTPIREREPPTSFTVLSRPPHRQGTTETSGSLSPASPTHSITSPALVPQPDLNARQRASTMINPTLQKDKSDTMSVISASRPSATRTARIPPVPLIHSIPDSPSVKDDYKPGRPRAVSGTSAISTSPGRSQPPSCTPVSTTSSSAPNKMHSYGSQPSSMPQRPFASNSSVRGESPAGSSTGDSSSGRSPFTPRDGSDIGMRSKDDASDPDSTLKARGHVKRPSVTFEDQHTRSRERATKTDPTNEQRTRERRRSEAKAAIELGKIVNGRRPLANDDSDEDSRVHNRNPAINVTMENGGDGMVQPNLPAWQQPIGTGMNGMLPPQINNGPAFFAAHQRALLIAKQAYQMAVAQHAMQMAGEEWERSSNAGFGSGGSVYGGGSGGSVYGGGSGSSVYGSSRPSVYGSIGGGMVPMSVMGMPNMGMLMPPNPWAARSSVAFPSAASVYGGISSSQSEYGGVSGWGTQSVYGDAFGPASSRASLLAAGASNSSTSGHGGSARPRASTSSQPASRAPGKSAPPRNRAAPPSSWKSGR